MPRRPRHGQQSHPSVTRPSLAPQTSPGFNAALRLSRCPLPAVMVVLVQLDDDVLPAHSPRDEGRVTATAATSDGPPADERPNPNINGFSAALSCYP